MGLLVHHDRQEAVLQAVGGEDVRDLGGDHRPEAPVVDPLLDEQSVIRKRYL